MSGKHEEADAKFAINCFVTCQYSRLSYPQQDLLMSVSVGVFIFSILRSTKYFRRRNITQYNTNNIGPMLEEFLMLLQYFFSLFAHLSPNPKDPLGTESGFVTKGILNLRSHGYLDDT